MSEESDSILNSIKKLLGLGSEYKAFDTDVMIHINSVLSTLHQLGVGPKEGYAITGDEQTWSEFLKDYPLVQQVKSYVYLRVRLLFDPPPHAFMLTAVQEQIKEMEWRMIEQAGEERMVRQNGS